MPAASAAMETMRPPPTKLDSAPEMRRMQDAHAEGTRTRKAEKPVKFRAEVRKKPQLIQDVADEIRNGVEGMKTGYKMKGREAELQEMWKKLNDQNFTGNKTELKAQYDAESARFDADAEHLKNLASSLDTKDKAFPDRDEAKLQISTLKAIRAHKVNQLSNLDPNSPTYEQDLVGATEDIVRMTRTENDFNDLVQNRSRGVKAELGRAKRKFILDILRVPFYPRDPSEVKKYLARMRNSSLRYRLLRVDLHEPLQGSSHDDSMNTRIEAIAARAEDGGQEGEDALKEMRAAVGELMSSKRAAIFEQTQAQAEAAAKQAEGAKVKVTVGEKQKSDTLTAAEAAANNPDLAKREEKEREMEEKRAQLDKLVAEQGATELAKMQEQGIDVDTLTTLPEAVAFKMLGERGWDISKPESQQAARVAIEARRRIKAGNAKTETKATEVAAPGKLSDESTVADGQALINSETDPTKKKALFDLLVKLGMAGLVLAGSTSGASAEGEG